MNQETAAAPLYGNPSRDTGTENSTSSRRFLVRNRVSEHRREVKPTTRWRAKARYMSKEPARSSAVVRTFGNLEKNKTGHHCQR